MAVVVLSDSSFSCPNNNQARQDPDLTCLLRCGANNPTHIQEASWLECLSSSIGCLLSHRLPSCAKRFFSACRSLSDDCGVCRSSRRGEVKWPLSNASTGHALARLARRRLRSEALHRRNKVVRPCLAASTSPPERNVPCSGSATGEKAGWQVVLQARLVGCV